MLFERNAWGGISATQQSDPNSGFHLQWQFLGRLVEEYSAATTDAFGRVVLIVKGANNHLSIQREVDARAIGNFVGWTSVGQ
jgi:hypothetical protein